MSRFTFHFLGMPHTTTHSSYVHCAYTSKVVKALRMLSRRGHRCIDYSNEGASVPEGVEHIDIFTEEIRRAYFGPHELDKLYHIEWDPNKPYWREWNTKAIEALKPRVKKGDFVLTLSGNCQQCIGDTWPGSYGGTPSTAMMIEWGIGYYGTFSKYRVFESHGHREWCLGKANNTYEDNFAAVVPNFFDLDDFPADPPATDRTKPIVEGEPYFLFIGRVIREKGIGIARHVAEDLKTRLVVAGQGDFEAATGSPPGPGVTIFGHANIAERASLMSGAIAVLNPTHFREPFGGTAVEAQLAGTPAITTDHGAFAETTPTEWRCASHREFVEAARRATTLRQADRDLIRQRARKLYSLEAIAPLYERFFQRLTDLWQGGWYEPHPVDPETIRSQSIEPKESP